ncbi:conserved hypothetical protein [Desulfamplus magnetovallimortis]|uniref:Reverse transcriptase domain-containing protein n=1 Tax=Desulfamplus magnetovallimortis TaxID=1246637 RepID=A0A1W1H847_9BACT|nr:reverse transcriptase domain-containing protein [Desulfamplus magnetovallimortis]SLM28555.1 conserved hypothetical protein [Desulfamplus magnetovallimortis]
MITHEIKGQIPLFSLENLYDAYLKCRKNKRNTINALRFEIAFPDNLINLYDELSSGTYHPSTSICFVQKKPKLREIFAADFRDRVIHHLLVGHLEPKFERIFIHDSYSCRKNRGIHGAVSRLQSFVNRVTGNGCRPAWYLKEDIRGFFMNIDQEILYSIICRHFKHKDVLDLSRRIIFARCIDDYHFKGRRSLLNKIPPHKTLFKVGKGKGLPIGNLTSQFFANVYLNDLDQFVKHELKCRYYIRYCDDFILLSDNPGQLEKWHGKIESFLNERLKLELNPSQMKLKPVSSGIDFLGYIVRRRYLLVRRRVVNNFKERIRYFDTTLSMRDRDAKRVRWQFPPDEVELFRSTVASYMGHLKWANSFTLKRMLFVKYPVLRACFMLNGYELIPRYIPFDGMRKFRRSYNWWIPEPDNRPCSQHVVRYPLWVCGKNTRVLVFFQVGCFYEFYNTHGKIAHEVLNLKLMKGLHRFQVGCGFHKRFLSRYIGMALQNGYHVAIVRQYRRLDGTVFRRMTALFRADEPLKVLEHKSRKRVQTELPFWE